MICARIWNRILTPTPETATTEDWPEDFSHENGKYVCVCAQCSAPFIGHKRRVTCRRCALVPVADVPTTTPLKACPFCGDRPRTDAGMGHAACDCMGLPIPWMTIEQWERRVPAPSQNTSTVDWEITTDQMALAFDDYAYALAWLTRYSVAFEYANDHPFEKPTQGDLLRWIQAMARLGCAVGNNSPVVNEMYSFHRDGGDDPAEVFNRIVVERRTRPIPAIEDLPEYVAPIHRKAINSDEVLGVDGAFWACSATVNQRTIAGFGDTEAEAKADLLSSATREIRGHVASRT